MSHAPGRHQSQGARIQPEFRQIQAGVRRGKISLGLATFGALAASLVSGPGFWNCGEDAKRGDVGGEMATRWQSAGVGPFLKEFVKRERFASG